MTLNINTGLRTAVSLTPQRHTGLDPVSSKSLKPLGSGMRRNGGERLSIFMPSIQTIAVCPNHFTKCGKRQRKLMGQKCGSRIPRSTFIGMMILWFLLSSNVFAADATEQKKPAYSKKGADTCLKCHDEDNDYPVLPIFKTKHGERNDPRSPMASLQCETCHGPVGDHKKRARKGKKKAPIRAFGSKAWTPVAEQNGVCLSCHNDHNRMNWKGSAHESDAIACADCHVIHARQEPMRDGRLQNQKCMSCHLKQRAEFNRTSAHPLRFGKMRCSQCHNPHGSFSDNLIQSTSVNALCYDCHAEKRGPLLWPHAPVDEDCTLCHSPHGSLHPALLKKRPPLLCQSCHSAAGHPSIAYDASGLPSAAPNQFLLGKSCLNCHSQVHGSNHPSGVKLLR